MDTRATALQQQQRDYLADMLAYVRERTAVDTYDPRHLARQIVEDLRRSDPDLLRGWLNENAVDIVWNHLRLHTARQRHKARNNPFYISVAAAENGDKAPLRRWLDRQWSVASGRMVRLAAMRKPDVRAIAERFGESAKNSLMQEAFFTAIADRLTDEQTVADAWTDEEIDRLWRSLP